MLLLYMFIIFFVGVVFGSGLTFIIHYILSKKNDKKLALSIDSATGSLKESFSDISFNALTKTTDHMMKIAAEKLSSERELGIKEMATQKQVLETRIEGLNNEISRLTTLVNTL